MNTCVARSGLSSRRKIETIMRLTNKETKIKLSDTKRYDLQDHKMFTKLSELEDIEERIGIDLVTLFRILEMFDKTIRNGERGNSYVSFPDGTTFTTDMGYVEEFIERFKKLINDYGKTWALEVD